MYQTQLRWIEIADERHFCEAALAERVGPADLSAAPVAPRCFPPVRTATSSLPSRMLSMLQIRCRALHHH
jgi:hypothetical protein